MKTEEQNQTKRIKELEDETFEYWATNKNLEIENKLLRETIECLEQLLMLEREEVKQIDLIDEKDKLRQNLIIDIANRDRANEDGLPF